MRLPIPQITMFVLVLHMGLGCCWHHEHLDGAPCCPVASVGQTPCGHHECEHNGHHHQHAADDGDTVPTSDQPQRRGDPCPEGRCVFVRLTESWQPVLDLTDETVAAVSIDVLLADVHNLSTRPINGQPQRWPCDTGPPLRAHLVLQILLI